MLIALLQCKMPSVKVDALPGLGVDPLHTSTSEFVSRGIRTGRYKTKRDLTRPQVDHLRTPSERKALPLCYDRRSK